MVPEITVKIVLVTNIYGLSGEFALIDSEVGETIGEGRNAKIQLD